MNCCIPPICPELGGHYFENLMRERMPEIFYRIALLEVMLSQSAIINLDLQTEKAA